MNDYTCSVEECATPRRAKGFCEKHYRRWKKHGDPNKGAIVRQDSKCEVGGCDSTPLARNLCKTHYLRWYKYGDAEEPVRRHSDAEQAFSAMTERNGECLEWTGCKSRGYGKLRVGGKMIAAHRYAWERVHGPILEGLVIDHMCWNPACVNVDHLRVVTQLGNRQNLSGAQINNKSGVRGVYRNERNGKWSVQAKSLGKRYYGGHFDNLEDAEAAAIALRKRVMPWSTK